ncbi:hypothetical protein KIPB_008346, partial [Kipferlia bialata]|eukprot:g8346.t1
MHIYMCVCVCVCVIGHRARITNLEFLGTEALFATSGADNAIKIWALDGPQPRLLKHRNGHFGGVNVARFIGEPDRRAVIAMNKGNILSCGGGGTSSDTASEETRGDTSVRISSTHLQRRNKELSQGKRTMGLNVTEGTVTYRKSAAYLVDSCELHSEFFPDIVTAHRDSNQAQLWSTYTSALCTKPMQDRLLGRDLDNQRAIKDRVKANRGVMPKRLQKELTAESRKKYNLCSQDNTPVSAVSISACGHFVLVGSMGGALAVYTVQNGRKWGGRTDFNWKGGVHSSGLVSLLALDGLRPIKTGVVAQGVPSGLTGTVTSARLWRDAGLLALVTVDGSLSLVDLRRVMSSQDGDKTMRVMSSQDGDKTMAVARRASGLFGGPVPRNCLVFDGQ